MKISKIIWVTSSVDCFGVYYTIKIDTLQLTDKQRKLINKWLELEGRMFNSFRLAQDIVNLARQQMKEKLK